VFHVKQEVIRRFAGPFTVDDFVDFVADNYLSVDPFGLVSNLEEQRALKLLEDNEMHEGGNSKVLSLTIFNAEDLEFGEWMVLVFAPWSAHCKAVIPLWVKLSNSERIGDIHVAAVNGEEYKSVARRFEAVGYPTIAFVKDRIVHKFNGEKTLENFITFATSGYKETIGIPLPYVGPSFVYTLDRSNSTMLSNGDWAVYLFSPWYPLLVAHRPLLLSIPGVVRIARGWKLSSNRLRSQNRSLT
jgi:thiol-disulfide isomerase/thioredoxin